MTTFNFFGMTINDDSGEFESLRKNLIKSGIEFNEFNGTICSVKEKYRSVKENYNLIFEKLNAVLTQQMGSPTYGYHRMLGSLSKLKEILDHMVDDGWSVSPRDKLGELGEQIKCFGKCIESAFKFVKDAITQPSSEQPDKKFAKAFPIYVAHLSSDRFKDRNGVSLGMKFKDLHEAGEELVGVVQHGFSQNRDLDSSLTVASRIVYVLTEFIGDALCLVPFHAPQLITLTDDIKKIEACLTALEDNASFDPQRKHVRKTQLLTEWWRLWQLSPTSQQINTENGQEKLKKSYTCYASDLITNNISKIYLDGDSKYDYSVLAGKLIAAAARGASERVKSDVGGAIRGGWIAKLDNELLAEIIATFAAGVAKKTAEYFSYLFLREVITNPKFAQISVPAAGIITKKELLDYLNGL